MKSKTGLSIFFRFFSKLGKCEMRDRILYLETSLSNKQRNKQTITAKTTTTTTTTAASTTTTTAKI